MILPSPLACALVELNCTKKSFDPLRYMKLKVKSLKVEKPDSDIKAIPYKLVLTFPMDVDFGFEKVKNRASI